MPGFVDVSNMSSLEIKRLGQADDYDEEDTYRPRRYGNRAQPAKATPQVGYAVSDVWAAACAAQRVNGEYVKENQYSYTDEGSTLVKARSRDVMMEFLQNPSQLTVDDVEQGEELRKWLSNDLTFRALKSGLTEFDTATQKCLAVTDRFYTVSHRYELAVVAALPKTYLNAKSREATQDRIAETTGQLIGNVGDKIQLNIEVIRTVFSKNWNCWFATAVTADNRVVFFSYKNPLTIGHFLTIKGTVKAHKDGQTQLNRVSII